MLRRNVRGCESVVVVVAIIVDIIVIVVINISLGKGLIGMSVPIAV